MKHFPSKAYCTVCTFKIFKYRQEVGNIVLSLQVVYRAESCLLLEAKPLRTPDSPVEHSRPDRVATQYPFKISNKVYIKTVGVQNLCACQNCFKLCCNFNKYSANCNYFNLEWKLKSCYAMSEFLSHEKYTNTMQALRLSSSSCWGTFISIICNVIHKILFCHR